MNKLYYTFLAIFLASISAIAQKNTDVLLTINDTPVTVEEFKQVYNKNLNLVQEEHQKTIDGYLDLFVDYKMKVAEAYAQKLNEEKLYKRDFKKYEEQLSRNYIYEDQLTEVLLQEAYDRSTEEIDASHILINCSFDALPQDTIVAYNKIKSLRSRAVKGEDFTQLVLNNSEEPGVKKSKGRLGYFTAFSMVYPFETMAYNTPVGEVSEIVRTRFGYHILKVHDRRKRGNQVSVSHIMVSTKDDSLNTAKDRIQDIYKLAIQGESFIDLAKQYSDDIPTASREGKIKPFGRGKIKSQPFEDAAFALKTPGEISKPMKTRFGWHIIKLNEIIPIPTFEEASIDIQKRIKTSDRSKVITNAVKEQLIKKVNFKMQNDLSYFEENVSDDVRKNKWEYQPITGEDNKVLFTMDDKKVYFDEFAQYINERQKTAKQYGNVKALLAGFLDEFETQEMKLYFREKLEKENPEYGAIIREYRDGLLIYEVMKNNVWDAAKKDTTGQKNFYEKNKENYMWKKRVEATTYTSSDKKVINQVIKMLKKGTAIDAIKKELNTNNEVSVIVNSGTYELGDNELPENFEAKTGISPIYEENNNYIVVQVSDIIAPSPKPYEKVEGRVLSAYQNQVEEEWMNSLRAKYTVDINKKTLKRLKKDLNQ